MTKDALSDILKLMRKVTPLIIEKIKFLRSKGYSVPEISREVLVGKTTVFGYIKGVKISSEYISLWLGKRGGSKERRDSKLRVALKNGESLVGNLTKKEKVLILCALYWAEGNKTDFVLTNTDPQLISVFINSLRQVLNITDDQLRISIRLYEDLDKDKSLTFWSQVVGIPKERFLSTSILSGKKKGKLEYGMCRVRVVKGGDLLKKVMSINKVIADRFTKL